MTKIPSVERPVDLIAEAKHNWDTQGWGESTAMAAATSITRAHQIVLARINEALAPLDLTFSRYEALVLISLSKAGSLPMGKVGERLQVHPTSVTNTINRLEGDGFVERRAHPTDKRTTLASITAAGRRQAAVATTALEAIRFGMGEVDDTACGTVTDALSLLRASAGDF